MIKKLRIRFIISAVASVLVVLTIILGVVNILNYKDLADDADYLLEILAENDGEFPDYFTQRDFNEDDIPGDIPGGNGVTAETAYETRFFTIKFNSSQGIISVDTGRISAVDTSTAIEMAVEAISSGKANDYLGNYRYLITVDEAAEQVSVIFVDRSKVLESARSFLNASILVAVIGIAAVAVLIIIFSGRITKPVAESYERQRRFITDAGHELKTPLAIINADVEVIEMDVDGEEEENEWLADIKVQTKRLADLTGELISLSKMEETPDKSEMMEFPFSDMAEETVSSFDSRAVAQGKTLTVDIQPDITVKGNEKGLRQLVSILCDNAMKYSLDGSEVWVDGNKQGKIVVLSVENDCNPVTKENIDHMFERFYRVDESRNSSTGGYGIGLSIAKAVVTGHKGRIQATTRDGNQLKITATIPLGTQTKNNGKPYPA